MGTSSWLDDKEAIAMKMKPGSYVLAFGVFALASACGAPTTPAQGERELADKTAAAQSDLLRATVEANYKIAMQQASNDAAASLEQCDQLTGDLQKGCKDHAAADFATARARAEANRTTHEHNADASVVASNAEPLTAAEYQAQKDRIEADHEAALSACDRLVNPEARESSANGSPPLSELEFQDSTNAKGICVQEANGNRSIALAELRHRRSGSDADRAKLAIAKAEAAHDVAQQKCDEMTPNADAVCMNDADEEEARATAAAK